ncbi:MAG TPA: selenocysteine-specific translation elongation factor [Gemmatimonadales bacterium]|nr:selenocysteine-specific translation elongation factor [Gemmatimonadales bacterium]
MIIGTAGHIDHGKSALIAALTGRTMDRLAEERRRGITIELNFAPLELGDGGAAGVVDVPGHEDFVRTMVAGASGFDLALLVVAADEGIMPQTLEHLAILEQLGVPAAIPVISKSDLVEPEWLDLVSADLAERLGHSAVAFDDPVATSAATGAGLEELRARIRSHAGRVAPRAADDAFRLPVDRAFSIAGVGTVVTGTAWSGSLALDDAVQLLPSGVEGRVRSLETHGRALERSDPGARLAVGIAGLDRVEARRGDVLVTADLPWAPTDVLDVEVTLLPSTPRPLAARSRVRLLLGTAEVMARVLPRGAVAPGGRGLARLRLESPVVARGGDRFVLRNFSPVTTIGGGRVLDPTPPARRAAWPAGLASDAPSERFHALVERRPQGFDAAAAPVLLGLPARWADEVGRRDQRLRRVGEHWVLARAFRDAESRALEALRNFHRRQPAERGMPLETLRRALRAPGWLAEAALDSLAADRRIRAVHGLASMSGFEPRVEGGDAEVDRLVEIIDRAGVAPPSVPELERETGRRDVATILRLATARGRVEPVERDRYYGTGALRRFAEVLREVGAAGDIHPAALRERLGISRKFLIPLLEWADARGITVRTGDARRLAPRADAGRGFP